MKPEISDRKEIIKIRMEINEIKTKKTIGKINEANSQLLKRKLVTFSQTTKKKEMINKNNIKKEEKLQWMLQKYKDL